MQWLPFVVFPIVGAIIGAITNQIAIRMLFRPYGPVFIGKWRLPFTPGLIPLQRETIARNIAETFESNLLSGDDFHKILTSGKALRTLEMKLDDFLGQHAILRTMLRRHKPEVMARILAGLEEMGRTAIADGGALNIAQRIEARINEMDIEQLEDLILGFSRKQFRAITFFGGVLGAVIGFVQAGLAVLLRA